jgi:hypothetical protein
MPPLIRGSQYSSGEATMVRATRSRNGETKRQFQVTTRSILKAAVEAQKLGGTVFKLGRRDSQYDRRIVARREQAKAIVKFID